MSDIHTYTTNVQWSAMRKGKLGTKGMPTIEVATPPEFPGGHPGIWSPEHLFVGSAEICLMTTFLSIAEKSKLVFLNYTSEATGTLEKTDAGMQFTRIVITPTVVVASDDDVERTVKILDKAERYCLISNSMKTEVSIEPKVVVRPLS
ncbi:MAG: osmotically inducible protein OsmC [Spirochaetae bacterium HGW-Spirochaetae-2]|nr:MAG: osmotically inducible protein OsmC [Spirochaetae bacterium HGW-Spirochaetae-2]